MTGAHHGYNGVPATQLPPRPSVQVSGVPGSTAPADEATLKRVKEDLLKEKQDKKKDKNGVLRTAAGARWWDPTLAEWSENDFRIFVGDLGNEVNDDALGKAFSRYPSFAKAKIVRDKRTNKSKGFGFVSFLDSNDFAKALKEMNGKYIGNRPCKLRKSTWDERSAKPAPKRKAEHGAGMVPPSKKKYHIPVLHK
eukprot:jgi/Chrzof1/12022/Cz06g18130.t1